jgi:hypothetical protein
LSILGQSEIVHLNKSQQAMAVAMIYPEPEVGGRGKKASKPEGLGVAAGYVSMARLVLKHTPTVAPDVLTEQTPAS